MLVLKHSFNIRPYLGDSSCARLCQETFSELKKIFNSNTCSSKGHCSRCKDIFVYLFCNDWSCITTSPSAFVSHPVGLPVWNNSFARLSCVASPGLKFAGPWGLYSLLLELNMTGQQHKGELIRRDQKDDILLRTARIRELLIKKMQLNYGLLP